MNSIKLGLKAQAKTIRVIKNEISTGMRSGKYMWKEQNELIAEKEHYRYYHIAYSMLRGREYLEIENKVRKGNEINMSSVEAIMDELKLEIAERNPQEAGQNA